MALLSPEKIPAGVCSVPSYHGDSSLAMRVISTILLTLFFVVGCVSNAKVIHAFRGKVGPRLRKSTAFILKNLAAIDLIACLVNIPLYFTLVVFKPQEDVLHFLSSTTSALTLVTSWVDIFCFLLLNMIRTDTVVRLNAQRLTPKRLRGLVSLAWFSAAAMGANFLLFQSSTTCKGPPEDVAVAKLLNPTYLCIFLLGFLTLIYMAVSLFAIRRSIRRQLPGIRQMAAQNRRERKIEVAIKTNIFFFLLTYLPQSIASVGDVVLSVCFGEDVNLDKCLVIGRTMTWLGHVMNPFIYARISPNFLKICRTTSSVGSHVSKIGCCVQASRESKNQGQITGLEEKFQAKAPKLYRAWTANHDNQLQH